MPIAHLAHTTYACTVPPVPVGSDELTDATFHPVGAVGELGADSAIAIPAPSTVATPPPTTCSPAPQRTSVITNLLKLSFRCGAGGGSPPVAPGTACGLLYLYVR